MATAMKHMASNFVKLDKFEVEGVDFRRWQKKMHFSLSSMSVVYVLTTPMPEDGDDNPTVEQVRKGAKWDNDDYVCRGLILNGMSDSLFDIYQNVETSKELWDTLEAKYMAEDASSKKFLEELTLVELGSHLRIEESLRAYNDNKGKRKLHDTKADPNKKPKVTCWKCGKPRHLKKDCEAGNVGNKANGLGTKGLVDGSFNSLKGQNMFNKSLQSVGIIHETTALYTPQQNGISERKNRVLKEMVNSMLSYSGLGQRFWGEAICKLPDPKLKTLDERGIECIFVGYAEHSKAFRFYVIEPNDSVAINSIIESRDVIFDENRPSVPRPSQRSLKDKTEDSGGSLVPKKVTERLQIDLQKKAEDRWNLARISTIRVLIAIASIHSLIIHQMDVKTAFLNGELDEEVYMNQPQGFIMHGNEKKVCKLIKSLYGLKQAPKQWHQKFDEIVLSNAYLLNQDDKCVYSKFDESGKGVIICLYVDDMLIFGTNQVQVDLTKEFLSSRFSIKDMGEADVILGIRIKHESNEITIYHSHYIEKVPKKFNYFDCTLVSTPMDTSETFMPNNGQVVSQLEYSRVIGCLMYAMTCTRAGTAFAIGKLSRYTINPEGYTDASWISNTEDNSSTSGWVFLLGGGAISWASKKQTCINGSTMKYEFVALAAAGKEAKCAATLAKAYSQMYNGKPRHLGVRHIMIRELITNEVVSIEFVRSQQNLADHLTKGLARDLVIKYAEGVRLNGLKHMYLHIIPRMCLEPAEKEDEVVNFLMVNFFEKVISRSMNKEEPPMYSNGLKDSILKTP
ncbi:zinc finger, CCHC-type containing protein [Tanacetum coccineum]